MTHECVSDEAVAAYVEKYVLCSVVLGLRNNYEIFRDGARSGKLR
jgi:hypothetical protein